MNLAILTERHHEHERNKYLISCIQAFVAVLEANGNMINETD